MTERPVTLQDLPAPEPSLGVEAYRRERELALAASPKCRENYERYLQASRRGASVDYLPIKLDVENVSRCNFKCTMCVVSEWPKGQRAEDMSFEDFSRLLDEQYGLVEIKLQGIGEPTMQGDAFFRMIRHARERHIWVRTTTNASLLHLKENYKKLVDSGVNEIQISIDGADKATFESIRVGSRFEKVVENCKRINAYCDQVGRWPTKSWTVVQRGNAHQLPEIVELSAAMGFRNHVFSLTLSDWGLDAWSERNNAVTEAALDPAFLMERVRQGERLGIKVRFWSVIEKYDSDRTESLCPWPFERAYVSSDLRVVPCCYVGNPEVLEIGKGLREEGGFSAVWTSEAYAEFRRDHLEGRIPRVCQGCYARGGERSHV